MRMPCHPLQTALRLLETTLTGMQIILPGALPDPTLARALQTHIQTAAPTLQRWRARGRTHRSSVNTAQTGCTAYEQWQLMQRGFTPEAQQNLSAGLGALLADTATDAAAKASGVAAPASDEPVWLAELVHIALASDGAALIPARHLEISTAHSQALLASAQPHCAGSGFALQPHSDTHWRVIPAEPLAFASTPLHCASPALVAKSSIHDWWPQQPQARTWRQLFNTLQMHWLDHPVNQARAALGLVPINGLWLFGGARPAQLHVKPDDTMQVYDNLYDPCARQDWGAWLTALAELERTVFAPLARAPERLILIGEAEILDVRPAAGWQFWRTWFGADR